MFNRTSPRGRVGKMKKAILMVNSEDFPKLNKRYVTSERMRITMSSYLHANINPRSSKMS